MYKHTILQIVKDQQAEFLYLVDGAAYYAVEIHEDTEPPQVPAGDPVHLGLGVWGVSPTKVTRYTFPVPLSDMGNAVFNRSEKAILLMRWIRKAYEAEELRMEENPEDILV